VFYAFPDDFIFLKDELPASRLQAAGWLLICQIL